jgi:hypothetical protein
MFLGNVLLARQRQRSGIIEQTAVRQDGARRGRGLSPSNCPRLSEMIPGAFAFDRNVAWEKTSLILRRWCHILATCSRYPIEVFHVSLLPWYVTDIHSVLSPFISEVKRISLIAIPYYAGEFLLKQSLELKRRITLLILGEYIISTVKKIF